MGLFMHPIEIASSADGPFKALEAYVDSGAIYTRVPATTLERMGVKVIDTATFITADGRSSQSSIGEVTIRIDGRERQSICVFGEEGTPPLLGAYTLEAFLLGVDPVNGTLVRIEGLRLGRQP